MSGFHIRVREPGVSASFEVRGSWGDDTNPGEIRKLLTDAYTAAMQRVDDQSRAGVTAR